MSESGDGDSLGDWRDETGERWLLGASEAAGYLGISPRNLWSLTRDESIPHLRIGKRVLYAPDELRRWARSRLRGNGGI
jgi:excisionase family DNA binding protein